jgi:hypothetical protein
MRIRGGAFGVATIVIGLLASGTIAQAQWAGGGTPIAIDFSGSRGTQPWFAASSLGRHVSLPTQVAALSSVPTAATDVSPFPKPPDAQDGPSPSLLQHLFASGIADLVRGNPAEAAEFFAATESATNQVPQFVYLTALAQLLSDFDHRDQALPLARLAMGQNPDHALYRILTVLAERDLSTVQADGALYFTPAGANQLHAAVARLPAESDAYNGAYLAALFGSIEQTGDPTLPERLADFAAMLGQGRSLKLAGVDTPQALGRLFVLSIPPEVFARAEAHFLAGITDGNKTISATASTRAAMVADRASVLVP